MTYQPTYESDIKPLVDAGATDPQAIRDTLFNSKVTVRPVKLWELTDLMNKRNMLTRRIRNSDDGEKWVGSVNAMVKHVESNASFAPFVIPVGQWFSHITNPRLEEWDIHESQWAVPFNQIKTNLADIEIGTPGDAGYLLLPTTTDFDEIIALGGGYKYETLTTSQVQTLITNEATRQGAITRQTSRNDKRTEISNRFRNAQQAMDQATGVDANTGVEVEAAFNAVWNA